MLKYLIKFRNIKIPSKKIECRYYLKDKNSYAFYLNTSKAEKIYEVNSEEVLSIEKIDNEDY